MLFLAKFGTPETIRTSDLCLRRAFYSILLVTSSVKVFTSNFFSLLLLLRLRAKIVTSSVSNCHFRDLWQWLWQWVFSSRLWQGVWQQEGTKKGGYCVNSTHPYHNDNEVSKWLQRSLTRFQRRSNHPILY